MVELNHSEVMNVEVVLNFIKIFRPLTGHKMFYLKIYMKEIEIKVLRVLTSEFKQ